MTCEIKITVFSDASAARKASGVEPVALNTEISPDGGLCSDTLEMKGACRPLGFDRTNGAEVWTARVYMDPQDLEVFLRTKQPKEP